MCESFFVSLILMNGQGHRSVVYSCLLNIALFLKVKGELSLSYLFESSNLHTTSMYACMLCVIALKPFETLFVIAAAAEIVVLMRSM